MSADERAYLSGFGILTHKGFVGTGEFRRELVDVQHVDRHGHPAGQNRTVWIRKEGDKNRALMTRLRTAVILSHH